MGAGGASSLSARSSWRWLCDVLATAVSSTTRGTGSESYPSRQAEPLCLADGVAPSRDAQLAVDRLQVCLQRVERDVEPGRDLAAGQGDGEVADDPELPPAHSQHRDAGRLRRQPAG